MKIIKLTGILILSSFVYEVARHVLFDLLMLIDYFQTKDTTILIGNHLRAIAIAFTLEVILTTIIVKIVTSYNNKKAEPVN